MNELAAILPTTFLPCLIVLTASVVAAVCSGVPSLRIPSRAGRSYLVRAGSLMVVVATLQTYLTFFDDPTLPRPERPVSVDLSMVLYRCGLALLAGLLVLALGLAILRLSEGRDRARGRRTEVSGTPAGYALSIVPTVVVGLLLAVVGVRVFPGSSIPAELLGGGELPPVAFALGDTPIAWTTMALYGLVGLLALFRLLGWSRRGGWVVDVGVAAAPALAVASALEAYNDVHYFHDLPERFLVAQLGLPAVVLLVLSYLGLVVTTLSWLASGTSAAEAGSETRAGDAGS